MPQSFNKTQPRFPGQDFDTYVQKANNLQIWNEEAEASRRYVVIRVDTTDRVTKVRVVTGDVIADYDTTGTLTRKFQAAAKATPTDSALISSSDTEPVKKLLSGKKANQHSSAFDSRGLLPIDNVYSKLVSLIGKRLPDPGADQERLRGQALHDLVQTTMGSPHYSDSGQFPDIQEQLLEVKLQTARTIDLGLVDPSSTSTVSDVPEVRHCDVRYAVFYASIESGEITLEHVILSTGEDFFKFFRRFEGRQINEKLQIHLPSAFFEE